MPYSTFAVNSYAHSMAWVHYITTIVYIYIYIIYIFCSLSLTVRMHALCVEESSDAESVIESGFKMISKLHFHVSLAGLYTFL